MHTNGFAYRLRGGWDEKGRGQPVIFNHETHEGHERVLDGASLIGGWNGKGALDTKNVKS